MKYNLIIIFIIIVCLFYIYENYNDKFKFKLYNINGQLINNENWEYPEQKL